MRRSACQPMTSGSSKKGDLQVSAASEAEAISPGSVSPLRQRSCELMGAGAPAFPSFSFFPEKSDWKASIEIFGPVISSAKDEAATKDAASATAAKQRVAETRAGWRRRRLIARRWEGN